MIKKLVNAVKWMFKTEAPFSGRLHNPDMVSKVVATKAPTVIHRMTYDSIINSVRMMAEEDFNLCPRRYIPKHELSRQT